MPVRTDGDSSGVLPGECAALVDVLDGELDALRQRQVLAVVDRAGLPAHVGLPGVGARLAAAAGFLLAAEGAADLGARGADVDVGDAAVAARGGEELLGRAHVEREDRRRETL